jgi:ankyrin repeat protein
MYISSDQRKASERMNEALLEAISHDDKDKVSSLLSSGTVNVNSSPMHLMRATVVASIELVTLLLNAGADVNATDDVNQCACFVAILNNRLDVLRLLLDRGAIIRDPWVTFIVSGTDARIVELLLDRGAPLDNLRDDDFIGFVVNSGSVAVVQRLLARGVDLSKVRCEIGRGTVCHQVIQTLVFDDDVEKLMRALVQLARVDVNVADGDGMTLLHLVAMDRIAHALRVLIELGADVDRQLLRGETPLHMLCDSWEDDDPIECIDLLLAVGANVHLVDKDGQLACHIAAAAGHSASLCAFAAAGSDLDQQDDDGYTSRKYAVDHNCALPTASRIESARRRIAKTRLDLVRQRAFQICLGLQPLGIDALQLCEIMMQSFGALGVLIEFHQWWKIATTVKHFRKKNH